MNRLPRLVLLVWLWMSLWLATLSGTLAQTSCANLRIQNEAEAAINEQAICDAARPWLDKGLQVYIFVTDNDPATEDAWLNIRDGVETNWGIFDPAADQFAKGALAFELSTRTSHPWGQDIAFGELLFNTPLDNDSAVGQIEGRLKNKVAEGDLTAALVDALTGSYAVAYPQTAGTQGNPSGQVPATPAASTSNSIPWGAGVVGLLALGAGGYFVVPRVITPAIRARKERQAKQQQLSELARKVGGLLYAARTLFPNQTVEETMLWRVFNLYGGQKYPEQAQQVRGWTEQSLTALGEALVLNQELDHREPGKAPADVDAMIRAYEVLYLTLVGTNKQILAMSDDELKSFIDPLAGGLEPVAQQAGLVDQVRAVRTELGQQPLQVKLTLADPGEVDADGVFGYANRIKEAIGQLAQAQDQAPAALTAAQAAREQAAGQIDLPPDMTAAVAFAAVDQLLDQATSAAQAEKWLMVQQHVATADSLRTRLATLLPQVAAAERDHQARIEEVQAIAAQGYRLPFFADGVAENSKIIGNTREAVQAGELDIAERSLADLVTHSSELLQAARNLVELRARNDQELQRLAGETARLEQSRTATAQAAWQSLQTYPQGNWTDLAHNFEQATATLQHLFDDPANANDLASTVARRNDMTEQQFTQAESDLVESFAAHAQAEVHLKALADRLAEVQQSERSLTVAFATTAAAIDKAAARRDRDNVKIDALVDQQLSQAAEALAQAKQRGAQREFLAAAQLMTEAQQLASSAYTSADQQAQAIDELYRQRTTVQQAATTSLQAATAEQQQLVAAARKAGTTTLLKNAQALAQQAKLADLEINGKEDQVLRAGLEHSVNLHTQTQTEAERAREQIRADELAYAAAILAAEDAIRASQGAIAGARTSVHASDAGGVGATYLSEAQQLLPNLPSYGATFDAYQRIIAQAEQSKQRADEAHRQARARIVEVEQHREAERRRREEAERRRREEQRQREERDRAAAAARSSSSYSSSSRSSSSSSSRSSSFGSSSSSRSSSMGSSRRR